MNNQRLQIVSQPTLTGWSIFIGFLLIIVVALRRKNDLVGGFTFGLVLVLLGLFTRAYMPANHG